jgi:hypothetical protein
VEIEKRIKLGRRSGGSTPTSLRKRCKQRAALSEEEATDKEDGHKNEPGQFRRVHVVQNRVVPLSLGPSDASKSTHTPQASLLEE